MFIKLNGLITSRLLNQQLPWHLFKKYNIIYNCYLMLTVVVENNSLKDEKKAAVQQAKPQSFTIM